jgi:hypothetical protein
MSQQTLIKAHVQASRWCDKLPWLQQQQQQQHFKNAEGNAHT